MVGSAARAADRDQLTMGLVCPAKRLPFIQEAQGLLQKPRDQMGAVTAHSVSFYTEGGLELGNKGSRRRDYLT